MSRAGRRESKPRKCPECGKRFMSRPKLERHLHVHRVAEESGQSFEEAADSVSRLIQSGVLVELRDGNLKLNEDRAADLFGDREAS